MLFMKDGKSWDLRIVEKPGTGDLLFEFMNLTNTERERFLLVRMDAYDEQIIITRIKLWFNRFQEQIKARRQTDARQNENGAGETRGDRDSKTQDLFK